MSTNCHPPPKKNESISVFLVLIFKNKAQLRPAQITIRNKGRILNNVWPLTLVEPQTDEIRPHTKWIEV